MKNHFSSGSYHPTESDAHIHLYVDEFTPLSCA